MGKWRYGVVLDAGSSGTRAHIYRWLHSTKARDKATDAKLNSLPVIETKKKWTKKIHPGISTFGEHPHDVGVEHVEDLLRHALDHIPAEDVPHTPLFLLATAGMRILPERQRKEILKEVCDFARKTTKFQLPDCDVHIQVIPGETEGLYGWIAANYLLGRFDQPDGQHDGTGKSTYGFLDMGGASAQIAFVPNATEAEKHADDLTLTRLRTIGGSALEYKVFVTTWLGFGVNQARERYIKALLNSSKSRELPDPCLPKGLKISITKDGNIIDTDSDSDSDDDDDDSSEHPKPKAVANLVGTGKFSECLHQTFPLLEKEKACTNSPCLINGQHVPAIDFDVNHFVGVSEYWHTTHEVFEKIYKDKAYDFKTYQQRVADFCNQDWKSIEQGIKKEKWGKKVDKQKAQEVCFKASWIINMLHDGIGVPRVGIENLTGSKNTTKAILDNAKEKGFIDPFQAVNKIKDTEVSWTLGKMVLYASSEVPLPDDKALAVGFGSNVPGIPANFQYPGGVPIAYESDNDWHRLFVENPQRIPAFFIMIFMIIFIICLILGRERRAAALNYLTSFLPKKQGKDPLHRRRRGFPFGLFGLGSSGQSYERVDLEDGTVANEFELDEAHLDLSDNELSDSSDGSRLGRTSGCATAKTNADAPGASPFFGTGDVVTQGVALGSGPQSAFNRAGLLSRAESSERVRSRASSPKRAKGGLGKLDE